MDVPTSQWKVQAYSGKPIVNLLEAEDIEFLVVNAQHMKPLPGRKTDVKDAEWIAQLLRHGLL